MTNKTSRRPGGRAGRLAETAGHLAGALIRWGPGVAGAALVCYGLGAAWEPLGWVAAGGFLLLLDRQTP